MTSNLNHVSRRKYLIGLGSLASLSGCSQDGDPATQESTSQPTATGTLTPTETTTQESPTPTADDPLAVEHFTRQKEAVYRTTENGPLSLKASIPSGDGPFPLIVHVHGGAWHQGSAGYRGMELLAEAGIATASMDYRLTGTAPHPAQIRDVNAAVRWLRANPNDWKIDPDRVALTGGSAGAHLSALLGAAPSLKKFQPKDFDIEKRPTVDAVMPHYGLYDLRFEDGCGEPPIRGGLRRLLDGSCDSMPLKEEVSPVTHIEEGDPPVLMFHGDEDDMLPVQQSRRYRDALENAGVPVEYNELAGVGHGYFGKKDLVRKTHKRMVEFLFDGPWKS